VVRIESQCTRGACSEEMQARIPNADYNVAVAADANDTPEQSDFAYYSYSMFGQMPDSGLPRE
jgi:hypothetical protein